MAAGPVHVLSRDSSLTEANHDLESPLRRSQPPDVYLVQPSIRQLDFVQRVAVVHVDHGSLPQDARVVHDNSVYRIARA